MGSELIYHEKFELRSRYIIEYKLHKVETSKKYPDGLRYRIICIDTKTAKRILMDNHHPKGHHYHIDDTESSYDFKGIDKLMEDFKLLSFNHLGVRL